MKAKVAWNKGRTASVVLSKLKEFTIVKVSEIPTGYAVRGWYNETNYFSFGVWECEEYAREFLDDLHKMF